MNYRGELTVHLWAFRYFLVGAGIGFVMPMFTFSTIPFFIWFPIYGGVAGAIFGSVAQAFHDRVEARKKGKTVIDEL
jgi:hypothetical protein